MGKNHIRVGWRSLSGRKSWEWIECDDKGTGITCGKMQLVLQIFELPRHIQMEKVRLCDSLTDEQVCVPLEGQKLPVVCIPFIPDGQRPVTGWFDITLRFWKTETYTKICNPFEGHKIWVKFVSFSSDTRRIRWANRRCAEENIHSVSTFVFKSNHVKSRNQGHDLVIKLPWHRN